MVVEATSSGACVEGCVGGSFASIVSAPLLGGDGLGQATTIQSIYGKVHEQAQELSHTGAVAGSQKKRKHKKKGDSSHKGVLIGVCLAVVGFLGFFLSQVFRSNASSSAPSSPPLPPPVPYRPAAAPSSSKPVVHEPLPDFSKVISTVETISVPLPSKDPVREANLLEYRSPLPYCPLPHLAPDISQFELVRAVASRSDLDIPRMEAPEKRFEAVSLLGRTADFRLRETSLPSIYEVPAIVPDALLSSRKVEVLECPSTQDLSVGRVVEEVALTAKKVGLTDKTALDKLVRGWNMRMLFSPTPIASIGSSRQMRALVEQLMPTQAGEHALLEMNHTWRGIYGSFSVAKQFQRIANAVHATALKTSAIKPKDPYGPYRRGRADFPKSKVIYLERTEQPEQHIEKPVYHIFYVNGICTDEERAINTAKNMRKTCPNADYHVIWNPTYGLVLDVCKSLRMEFFDESDVARNLITEYRQVMKDPRNVIPVFVGYSQGTDHVRAVLKEMTPDERKRVIVITLGPATVITRDLCPNAVNYISTCDPVPLLKNPGIYISSAVSRERGTQSREEVVLLQPEPGASRYFDHEIDGPTYQKALQQELIKRVQYAEIP